MSDLDKRLTNLSPEKRALLTLRLKNKQAQTAKKDVIQRRADQDSFPLSFAQQRLWFLDQLESGSSLYTIAAALRLTGTLDITALERSLGEVKRRHEVLRSRFVTVKGRPAQVIAPAGDVSDEGITIVDLRDWPADEREGEALRLATEEAQRPFDLRSGPLLRASLIQLDDANQIMLLTLHHIASDGWSTGVLVREIAALYDAFAHGRPSPLSALPLQYADYAAWQRHWLQGEGEQGASPLQTQLAYWKQQLGGKGESISPLPLPTDRSRPAIQTFRGAHHGFRLPERLVDRLKTLSQQEEATLFMVLLTAFQALLYRYTGQEDISVGTPIANRTRGEIEELIGLFINTLVLRADLSGDPSFRELLRRVREVTLEAYVHQDVPFEMLVEELHPQRDMSRTPLFQVMLVLQNAAQQLLNLPGLTLELIDIETGTAKFDLLLQLEDGPGGIKGVLEYNTDLFDAATIERMAGHFETLLEGIATDPECRVSALPLLSAAERRTLLVEWNTPRAYPAERCLHQLFEAQAERRPTAVALTCEQERLTYAELNARANQLAHHLQSLGVGPETLVALSLDRSLDLVVAILGVLKAGGAYLPLDLAYPPERLRYMLDDAQAKVLITTQEQRTTQRVPDQEQRTDSTTERKGVLHTPPADDERAYSTTPPTDHGQPTVVELDADWPTIARQPATNLDSAARPDNLAYVIYTSGSTGKPKGVQVTHANVVRLFTATEEWYHFDERDVWTLFHSYAFDFSVWELWGALLYGGRLVLVPYIVSRSPDAFYELLAEEQVTILNQTPSAFRQLIRAEQAALRTRELALRYVIFGGEALEFASLKPWFEHHGDARPQLVNMYGITETTVHVTYRPITLHDLSSTPGSVIGRPIPDLLLYVLDQQRQPVPIGVPGELYVGGAGVARGYLNRPDLTDERFIPNPFAQERVEIGDWRLGGANSPISSRLYKTGDLARLLPDGDIEYLGRIDQQVKLRGFRIELGEIEAVIGQYPRVREQIVLVREDTPGDKRLVAYIVADQEQRTKNKEQNGETPDSQFSILNSQFSAELRAFLKGRLPEYMVPAAFVVLEALPLTPNGKIDRKALPAPDGARPELEKAYVAPRTDLEQYLANMWHELLGIEQIGVYDNFFELGGDSIQAAVLANRIQEELGVGAHVRSIFYAPTVADLSMYFNAYFPDVVAERFKTSATKSLKTRLEEEIAPDDQTAVVDESKIALIRQIIPALPPRPEGERATKNPPAVFILSPPRSGSTLLRVMLAGHPQLFSPPELELLTFNTLVERRQAFSGVYDVVLEGTIRAIMEARGYSTDQAVQLMEEYERRNLTTRQFYTLMQEWIGERLLVDKTPAYAMHMDVLRRAEAEFENARYIHLVRHPYATIYSFVEARLHEFFFRHPHPFSIRELAELIWLISHQNVLEFLKDIPTERQHRVRYEDLVSHPQELMEQMCRFLGVEFHPDMAQPYQGTRMTDGIRPMSQMVGDLKFYLRKDIDPKAADRWKNLHADDFLSAASWRAAEQVGYQRPAEPEQPGDGAAPAGQQRLAELLPTPRNGALPLSFAQQRLWFLDQLEPGNAFYNVPAALRLKGPLDYQAFQQSFSEIVRRHEILRTTFGTVDGQPVQVIGPGLTMPLPMLDLRQTPEAEREAEVRRLIDHDARKPFDLERGPLLRAALLRLGEQEHVLVMTLHHIIADGWSAGVLVREIAMTYPALAAGRPSPLSALAIQYADYATWQRQWLHSEAIHGQIGYWKRQLAGSPPLLELPTDRPRPAVQNYDGARRPFMLPQGLSDQLKVLSQQAGVTLFMTLAAVFQTLLARYSGQDDICIGTPVANRSRAEISGLIGFFVNMLVLRGDLSGDPSFRELLERVQKVATEAYAHQDVPFEMLVDELQPERNLSHTPLFQVVIALQKAPLQRLELPGITLEPMLADSLTAKFDLTLSLVERTDGLRGAVEYNTDLFDEATIARMLGHFQTLLEAVVVDPDQRISRLPLLGEAERREVLFARNVPATYPAERCLHQLFEAQAERRPTAVALTCEQERLTYAELNTRANQLAHRLQSLGVGPETLVALSLDRSLDLVVAILAVLKAGGAYLPLDLAYPPERLAFMLEDAQARVLLTTQEQRTTQRVPDQEQRTDSTTDRKGVLHTPPADDEKAYSTTPPADDERAYSTTPPTDHEQRIVVELDADWPTIAMQPATNLDSAARPDNLAYVIYTSGSTGKPKGVQVTHANVVRLFSATEEWYHFDERDVWTLFHSYAFDFSVWELWGALLYGGRLVIVPYIVSRSPDAFYELLAEEQVTILNQTPSAFRQLIRAEQAALRTRELALRYVIFGGEALEFASLKPWFERHGDARPQLVNMYGITETTVHVTYRPITLHDLSTAPGSVIGRPIPDLLLYVLDQQRQPVPIGVPGELYVGGAGVARGYLNRPELTDERFIPNPFAQERVEIGDWRLGGANSPISNLQSPVSSRLYKTGDLARLLPDGDIEYLGRIDQQVKLRGFRIELGEIEAVIGQHPGVREQIVLVREDMLGDKRLVAYIVADQEQRTKNKEQNGETPDSQFSILNSQFSAELRAFLKGRLPEYMVPAAFVVLDALPLTPNGKVDRRALPVPDGARPELSANYAAARTPEEETLAGIWAQVLGLKQVGVHDNFFELGGDSILSIQVIARANQAGLRLTPRQLFQAPTVAGLAALAGTARPIQAQQGAVEGPAPLTPIQRWFFEQEQPDPQHWNQAMLLEVRMGMERPLLEATLGRLLTHHDALRLRFTRAESGWRQVNAGVAEAALPVGWVDLSALPEAQRRPAIEAAAAEAQARLDLSAGPLIYVTYFDLGAGRPGRLLLVVHHLAIDGVSWRVLLEDFQTVYLGLSQGVTGEDREPPLPPKTTSFLHWAERLAEYAQSEAALAELDYWAAPADGQPPRLPLDIPGGDNREELGARRGGGAG